MRETRLTRDVDSAIQAQGGVRRRKDEKQRGHLGASIIGDDCWRKVFYAWRWAADAKPEGRMLRLWERGHREEEMFIEWLETVGASVRYIDWDNSTKLYYFGQDDVYMLVGPGDPEPPEWFSDVSDVAWQRLRAESLGIKIPEPKQFGFTALWGHFKGSMDGLATGVPYAREHVPDLRDDEEILAEFKTHNLKSFTKLVDDGVKVSKPEHYTQMCTYMEQKGLRLAIYCAVCKDSDELYYEFVMPDTAHANETILKAQAILECKTIPGRLSNSPSFWKCRYCDFRMQCHFGQPMKRNCRTCRYSMPVDNGQWRCNGWGAIIPFDAQLKGCEKYNQLTD